jgi:serine/threonine-protein kinase TTK/MPS1
MQFYALKRIDTRKLSPNDLSESIENEVTTLRSLREERNIIFLHEDEYDARQHVWSMLFTMGETDLDTLVKVTAKDNTGVLPENFIRYYWQQMVEAVQTIHNQNIVHTDLKPANFVCVKGVLKLIDFGIARRMQEKPDGEATSVIRSQVVGTVSYMAPETLEHHDYQKVGRCSDVWSLGIILYQLVYGAPPFYSLPNQQQRMLALLQRTPIEFKPLKSAALLQIMRACLNHDPAGRPTVASILKCDFLCPPSS